MRFNILTSLFILLTLMSCKKDKENKVTPTFQGVSGRSFNETVLASGHTPIMSGYVDKNDEYITISIPAYSSSSLNSKVLDAEILTFDVNGLLNRQTIPFDLNSHGSTVSYNFGGLECHWPTNTKIAIAPFSSKIITCHNLYNQVQDLSKQQVNQQTLNHLMAMTTGIGNKLFLLESSYYIDQGKQNWSYVGPRIQVMDTTGNVKLFAQIDSVVAHFSGGGGGRGPYLNNRYYSNHNTFDMAADASGNLWIVSPYIDGIVRVNASGVATKTYSIPNPVSIASKGDYLYVLTEHMLNPTNYTVSKHPQLWEIAPGGSQTLIHTFNNLSYQFKSSSQSTPSEDGLLEPYDANFNISIDNSNNFYLSNPQGGEVVVLK